MRRSATGLVLVASLLAACGGQTATAQPTDTPATLGELAISSPSNGAVSDTKIITVTGTAPDGAEVVRDISRAPDDTVSATGGTWSMSVDLDEGVNRLKFRIGDDKTTAREITVIYHEAAITTPELTAEPMPSATAASTVRPAPAFRVIDPLPGATVTGPNVVISGTAPAGERVVRDIAMASDDEAMTDADGRWTMSVALDDAGPAALTFRLGDDRATEIELAIVVHLAASAEWLTAVCPVWGALSTADRRADGLLEAALARNTKQFERLGKVVRAPSSLAIDLFGVDMDFAGNFAGDLYDASRTYQLVASKVTAPSGGPASAEAVEEARATLSEARALYAALQAKWTWTCAP